MKFLQPLQDWCEKFKRSMSDRMMLPSLLNISPKKNVKFAHVDSQCKSGESIDGNFQKCLQTCLFKSNTSKYSLTTLLFTVFQ